MGKPLIVIADMDEKYLAALEYKFLDVLGEKALLEMISERAYFENFFAQPRTAEIVVVDEKLYTRELQRHNIANLFVLTEETGSGSTEELNVNRVYKYSGIKEIFHELLYRSREKLLENEKKHREAQVISLYSAAGGSGKTCLGLGLAECLAQNHQRVLYINTESIQGFAYYVKNQTGMPNAGYYAMREDKEKVYNNIRRFLVKENFDYVPAFYNTLDSLNLDYEMYCHMLAGAKESGEYDVIIVDVEAGYSREKMELLQYSDKIIMVLQQDAVSMFKAEYILGNIDWRGKDKYIFVCNQYQEDKEDVCKSVQGKKSFVVNEYVEKIDAGIADIQQIAQLNGVQRLAYMFL